MFGKKVYAPLDNKFACEYAYDVEYIILKKAYELLQSLSHKSGSSHIRFPDVFQTLGRHFGIPKRNCWVILAALQRHGVLEITFGHGIDLVPKKKLEGQAC